MCKWRIALIPIMPLSRFSLVSRLSELLQEGLNGVVAFTVIG